MASCFHAASRSAWSCASTSDSPCLPGNSNVELTCLPCEPEDDLDRPVERDRRRGLVEAPGCEADGMWVIGRGFALCMGEGNAGEVEFVSPAVYVLGRARFGMEESSASVLPSVASSRPSSCGTGLRLTELLRRTRPLPPLTLLLRELLEREMSPICDIKSLSVIAGENCRCCIACSFQAGTPGNCIANARTTSRESEAWLATVRVL